MKWYHLNFAGVQTVMEEHWLTKKDASLFFSRRAESGRLISDTLRLTEAVVQEKVRTKTLPNGRTGYNAWDCMCACKIL